MSRFNRSEMIFGSEAMGRFAKAHVAIVGLGGVGSFVAEMLARSGFGTLILIDFDKISLSNINRQIPALTSTVGMLKSDVMTNRIKDINPDINVVSHVEFCDLQTRDRLLQNADFIVDAIDSLGPKAGLLEFAVINKLRIISCMGAGNRIDPSKVALDDISNVKGCPLAKRVKKYLRKRGIESGFPVVYSYEAPVALSPVKDDGSEDTKVKRGRERITLGSVVYLPAVIAGWAVSYIMREIAAER
jgi:tRNA threonylcarbamoyladenosine dehydratase